MVHNSGVNELSEHLQNREKKKYQCKSNMANITSFFRQVPKQITYGRFLRNKDEAYLKLKDGVFALLDCDNKGKLINKYVIIELKFDQVRNELNYVCSCGLECCLHIKELVSLSGPHYDYIGEEIEDFEYTFFTETLIGIFCKEDKSYSIIGKTQSVTKCLKCKRNVKNCKHIHAYMDFMGNAENPPLNVSTKGREIFKSISTELIPYNFLDPTDLKVWTGYISGQGKYPTELCPHHDPSKVCQHGNLFSEHPIKLKVARLHLEHFTHNIPIYYRPAIGCDCRQNYEGRSDLLLNLDNTHIFSYVWLFNILHYTQENHLSLHGAFRSSNLSRMIGEQPKLRPYLYDKLRFAYNCFVRMLDLNFEILYTCPHPDCETEIQTIVMDGIQMGGRKDLLPHIEIMPTPEDKKIQGSTIQQRLFVRAERTRRLLASYATISKRGRYTEEIKPLSDSDYDELCNSLSSNPSLQAVITEAGNPCPISIRTLAGELSRLTPTCGILQITGDANNQVHSVLTQAVNGNDTDLQKIIFDNMDLLKKACPLVIEFLLSENIQQSNKIKLLKDLIISLNAPFTVPEPSEDFYGPLPESEPILGFFPNHPLLRGRGNYDANKPKDKTLTGCRKQALTHPTLNPGIFTFFLSSWCVSWVLFDGGC